MSWQDLVNGNGELAASGAARINGRISYLATVDKNGRSRVHPVTPIVGEGRLLLFMEPTSPKGFDIRRNGRYALHCGVENNEGGEGEFFVRGQGRLLTDPESRAQAVQLASYKPHDRYILFELGVDEATFTQYGDHGPQRQRWQAPGVRSLLGHLLPPLPASEAAQANLAQAQTNFATDPTLDNTIWLGRRLAYVGQLAEAIQVYSDGLKRFPQAHQLYRHRGHRYISTRQFALAVADFERAAVLATGQPVEVEPDGIPNRLNQPTSNGHFNIWYHLGLAYYLTGQLERAAAAYKVCMTYSDNPDSVCATSDWLYMTLRELGRHDEAAVLLEPIHEGMELVESQSYHRRLLMYKGVLSPSDLLDSEGADDIDVATQGYGVGNYYRYTGEPDKANAIFRRVLQTSNWSAFGYIAAEVALR